MRRFDKREFARQARLPFLRSRSQAIKFVAVIVGITFSTPSVAPLVGQDFNWINSAGGSFEDGANWHTGSRPSVVQNAVFGISSTYGVRLNASETVSETKVIHGDMTLFGGNLLNSRFDSIIDKGTLRVTGAGTELKSNRDLLIGNGGSLFVNDAATVTNQKGLLGDASGTGSATVSGIQSQWNSQNLFLGTTDGTDDVSAGFLNSSTSGRVHVGNERVNNTISQGRLIVSDSGGAAGGFGRTYVRNGSTATAGSTIVGLSSASSFGRIEVAGAGSTLNAGSLLLGNSGIGEIDLSAGGVLNSDEGFVGVNASSNGTIAVSGADSRWDNTNDLTIGYQGTGTLDMSYDSRVNSGNSFVGRLAGSSGTVSNGTTSHWYTSNLHLGGNATTDGGSAEVRNHGVMVVGDYVAGNSSSLYVSDSGSNGNLIVRNGAKFIESHTVYVGGTNGSGTISVSGAGSLLIQDDGLFRVLDDGETLIQNGGEVLADYLHVDGGSMSVDGASSRLSASRATVQFGTSIHLSDFGQLNIGAVDTQVASIMVSGNTLELFNGSLNNDLGDARVGFNFDGLVEMRGSLARWGNGGKVILGDHVYLGTVNVTSGAEGSSDQLEVKVGTMLIRSAGSKWTTNQTSILSDGNVTMEGGRFEFGVTNVDSYGRIYGTSGSLAGEMNFAGLTEINSLEFSNTVDLDTTDVSAVNSGVIHGSGLARLALNNTNTGELRTLSGQWARFTGAGNINSGEINNFGGVVEFDNNFTNLAGGFVGGRGQLIADGGTTNEGVMAFSGGNADILGDFVNASGGQVVTSGLGVTTFFDDVQHNGAEIRTAEGSATVFLGEYGGSGSFTGSGDVFFEGDLRPGNSPDIVEFAGNVNFGANTSTFIELAGLDLGEFDRLEVGGNLFLDGTLSVQLIDGFSLGHQQQFIFADVTGELQGGFAGLSEGDSIGTYGGVELFVSYGLGDGNDVGFFTSAVPEPSAVSFLILIGCGVMIRRRRTSEK